MYYVTRLPRPSVTKVCALQVFCVVRRALDYVAVAAAVAQEAGQDIADAWKESGQAGR